MKNKKVNIHTEQTFAFAQSWRVLLDIIEMITS